MVRGDRAGPGTSISHKFSASTFTAATVVALMLLSPMLALFPTTASEPVIVVNPDETRSLVWNFDDPANFTTSNAVVGGGFGTLAIENQTVVENTQASYDLGVRKENISTSQLPGSIVLDNAAWPVQTLALQPDPTEGVDTFIEEDSTNSNNGDDNKLKIDSETNKNFRTLMWFNLSAIPSGAVIHNATLWLYLISGRNPAVTYNVHPLTTDFMEGEVTWNRRSIANLWATPGGDYEATSFARGTFTNSEGWQSVDLSRLVEMWSKSMLANYGFIIVPVPAPGDAVKEFTSSDETSKPEQRPRLVVNYAMPGISGAYESRALGPGTNVTFTLASWMNSTFSFATDEFSGTNLSTKWNWLNVPNTGGASYNVGLTRPGWLHIVSERGLVLENSSVNPNLLYQEITGDFAAGTHVDTAFSDNQMGAGLLMIDDPLNWVAVYVRGTGVSAKVVVDVCENGVSSAVANIPWNVQTDAYLWMDRNADTIITYYSADGAAWTQAAAHTFTWPLMQRVMVGVFVVSSNALTATADFNYFRITPVSQYTTLEVRARVGNTSILSDPSWEPWGAALPSSTGSVLGEQGRFVQYQVVLSTSADWFTPYFGGFTCHYEFYYSIGTIQTEDYAVDDFSRWYTITTYQNDSNGSVEYSYSTDHGTTWSPYVRGGSYSIPSTQPSMMVRMRIQTSDPVSTPKVDRIVVTYGTAISSFFLVTPASVVAGESFSVTVYAKDAANQTMTMWTGPIALHAVDASGTGDASGELFDTSAWITSGGYVTVTGEKYFVAETIRILASSASTTGLSAPITVLHGPVASVAIQPEIDRLQEYTSQVFNATALDAYGNIVPDASYVWSADEGLGTLVPNGASATLTAGAAPAFGYLGVIVGGFSDWLYLEIIPFMFPPEILEAIPDQQKPEDFGSWAVDLTPYVYDAVDGHERLRWYVTNNSVVKVSGENETGNMELSLRTIPDAFGKETLYITFVNSAGLWNRTTFEVDILPVNDRPTIDHITPLVVTFDIAYGYNFLYYIHDVDNVYDELSLSVDPESSPYAAVNALWITFNYPESMNGTEQYVVLTVSDGYLSSSTVVRITVSNDRVPELRDWLPDLTMYQGEAVLGYFDLDSYFFDPDLDILFYASGNERVEVTIHLNHSVDFVAPTDWSGWEYVIFIALDPYGARIEEAIIVTVLPVNQPPSIANVPDLVVRFDVRYDFPLDPYVTDPDDPLESLSVTTDDSHIAVIGLTLSLMYPQSMNGTTVGVTITVSDSELSDSRMINVTISDNHAPEVLNPPDHEFLEDVPVNYPVGTWLDAHFTDNESASQLTFTAFTSSPNLTAIATVGWQGNWTVLFTPDKDWYGSCGLTIRATDPRGAIAETTVTLDVLPVPDAPYLTLPVNVSVALGSPVAIDLSQFLTDADPEDQDFEYAVSTDVGIQFDIHESILVLDFPESFLGGGKFSGTCEVKVRVMDPHGLSDTEAMIVTVFRPPQAEEDPWLTVIALIAGGAAFGLFMVAMGLRKRPFVIRDMMLIHNDGFLMARHVHEQKGEIDEQILSGMLTAVLNFVEDSTGAKHDALKTFGFQNLEVMVRRGTKVYAAVVFEGDAPDGIEGEIGTFLEKIERVYKKSIASWSGDLEADFAGMGMLIQAFVKEHSRKAKGEGALFWNAKPPRPRQAEPAAK